MAKFRDVYDRFIISTSRKGDKSEYGYEIYRGRGSPLIQVETSEQLLRGWDDILDNSTSPASYQILLTSKDFSSDIERKLLMRGMEVVAKLHNEVRVLQGRLRSAIADTIRAKGLNVAVVMNRIEGRM